MARRLVREARPLPATDLYDRDFHLWCVEQAASLREGRLHEVDRDNLAEEIDALGKDLSRGLRSAYRLILLHLLKCKYQPQLRTGSWEGTIVRERADARERLEESPSLERQRERLFEEAYRTARREAAAETRLPLGTFPVETPFAFAQVIDDEFWPDEAA